MFVVREFLTEKAPSGATHTENMANTYTQIYIHVVFAVQGRHCLLPKRHKEALHKYIAGITRKSLSKTNILACLRNFR